MADPADSLTSDIVLPAYMLKGREGVFVFPSRIPADDGLRVFIDRLFSYGMRFAGLDYGIFQRLLYDISSFEGQVEKLKLADDIVVFPDSRKQLYKEVRVMDKGARAEYMFEPAYLELKSQAPVYGPADENGIAPIIEYREVVKTQPTKLDFDEFVAEMWVKGVRFGIDVAPVKKAIDANLTERAIIATELEPVPGRDAELQEACEGLHRDDSPLIKASGKADLKRFKNRFPQITKNQRMMKKIPRRLGEPGYKVTGELVEPDSPKDIDLQQLAGPGTRIDINKDGEFILAIADGFLSIDTDSNMISVTEKIENTGGISAKTTGDLSLTVDDFVERGEVQEGRVVEGKHMTFFAAVYGTLLSRGGNIVLEDNLSGGAAKSPGGSITVKRRTSNSTLEAVAGKIDVSYAENCTMIARDVTIEHAINCTIVADKVFVELAEGCSIAGRSVEIASSDARRETETIVTMLVPDSSGFNKQTAELEKIIGESERVVETKARLLDAAKSDPDFARFLSVRAMIRDGSVKLTPEQQQNFRQMIIKFTPSIKTMEKLSEEKQAVAQTLTKSQESLERLKRDWREDSAGRQCKIAEVVGETCVQMKLTNLGVKYYSEMPAKEMKSDLRFHAPSQQRIFLGSHGSVDWHYEAHQ